MSEAGLRLETAYREWCNSTKCYSNSKNVAIEGIKSQFPLWKIIKISSARDFKILTDSILQREAMIKHLQFSIANQCLQQAQSCLSRTTDFP